MENNFKISDIKNIDLVIAGMDYAKYQGTISYVPDDIQNPDFKKGFELSKRINKTSYKKAYKKCK